MTFIFFSDFVMYIQLPIAFLHRNKCQHSQFFFLSSFSSICNKLYFLHFLYWRLPCQHMERLHIIFTSFFSLYLLFAMLSSSFHSFIVLISHIFSSISSFPFHSPYFLPSCSPVSIYFVSLFFLSYFSLLLVDLKINLFFRFSFFLFHLLLIATGHQNIISQNYVLYNVLRTAYPYKAPGCNSYIILPALTFLKTLHSPIQNKICSWFMADICHQEREMFVSNHFVHNQCQCKCSEILLFSATDNFNSSLENFLQYYELQRTFLAIKGLLLSQVSERDLLQIKE